MKYKSYRGQYGFILIFRVCTVFKYANAKPSNRYKNHFQMCPYFHDDKHVDIDS